MRRKGSEQTVSKRSIAAREADAHAQSLDAYVARSVASEHYARLQMIFSGTVALALLAVAIVTDSQGAGLALALPIVFFAYAFEQWQDARGGRESLRHDVIALSNVLYQDATVINRVLEDEMIHEYLQNLLQAALNDEEFGRAYWKQAVRPFVEHGEKGFREDWRYRIDLASLPASVEVPVPQPNAFAIEPGDFWNLGSTATYRQHVKQPRDEYYVGCTFSLRDLPDWFRDEGFLLRELTHLSSHQREALAATFTGSWVESGENGAEAAWGVAATLFRCELKIAGRELVPEAVQLGELGVRWRFAVDDELREALADPVEVRISVSTFQPRDQAYFPVNITLPTRHPTVQFSYGQTTLSAEDVEASVFFSAEQPYRPELIDHDEEAKRIELRTAADDWVFAGSGCMFLWTDRAPTGAPVGAES